MILRIRRRVTTPTKTIPTRVHQRTSIHSRPRSTPNTAATLTGSDGSPGTGHIRSPNPIDQRKIAGSWRSVITSWRQIKKVRKRSFLTSIMTGGISRTIPVILIPQSSLGGSWGATRAPSAAPGQESPAALLRRLFPPEIPDNPPVTPSFTPEPLAQH